MDQIDIRRCSNPRDWPRWPWLPLKRQVGGGKWPGFACLHADTAPDTKPCILYAINVFEVKTYFPTQDMPIAATFADWREFTESDWQVD